MTKPLDGCKVLIEIESKPCKVINFMISLAFFLKAVKTGFIYYL